MGQYPNYRVSVEAIILRNNKVLLMKRAGNCAVAPGVWHVPAGKVKYEEIPHDAIIRECKEETGYNVSIIKELNVRAFKMKSNQEDAYRLAYTYLLNIESEEEPILNDEHTEYAWAGIDELNNKKYASLLNFLKELIQEKVLKVVS